MRTHRQKRWRLKRPADPEIVALVRAVNDERAAEVVGKGPERA